MPEPAPKQYTYNDDELRIRRLEKRVSELEETLHRTLKLAHDTALIVDGMHDEMVSFSGDIGIDDEPVR